LIRNGAETSRENMNVFTPKKMFSRAWIALGPWRLRLGSLCLLEVPLGSGLAVAALCVRPRGAAWGSILGCHCLLASTPPSGTPTSIIILLPGSSPPYFVPHRLSVAFSTCDCHVAGTCSSTVPSDKAPRGAFCAAGGPGAGCHKRLRGEAALMQPRWGHKKILRKSRGLAILCLSQHRAQGATEKQQVKLEDMPGVHVKNEHVKVTPHVCIHSNCLVPY
jgi:hypothetical protein